jgi:hypothetical protein
MKSNSQARQNKIILPPECGQPIDGVYLSTVLYCFGSCGVEFTVVQRVTCSVSDNYLELSVKMYKCINPSFFTKKD